MKKIALALLLLVMLHELAHVRRGDWLWHLLAGFACILYWWNPIVWLLAGRLRRDAGAACDALVLLAGVKASDYTEHLLSIIRSLCGATRPVPNAVPVARRRNIESQLRGILPVDRPRTVPGRQARLRSLGASLLVLAAVAWVTPTAHMAPLPDPPLDMLGEKPDLSPDADPAMAGDRAAQKDRPVWGGEVEGLQAGIRVITGMRPYSPEDTVTFEISVRNVGPKAVAFSYLQDVVVDQETGKPVAGLFHENPPVITDGRGETLPVLPGEMQLGRVPVVRVSLNPQDTVVVGRATLALGSPGAEGDRRHPTLLAGPGSYTVTQQFRYQRRPGVNESLATGELPLTLAGAGTASGRSQPGERESETILREANEALRRYLLSTRREECRSADLARELWGPAILGLKPARVYEDRVNVAIVLKENADGEEGLYAALPISSYTLDARRFSSLVRLSQPLDGRLGALYRYTMAKQQPQPGRADRKLQCGFIHVCPRCSTQTQGAGECTRCRVTLEPARYGCARCGAGRLKPRPCSKCGEWLKSTRAGLPDRAGSPWMDPRPLTYRGLDLRRAPVTTDPSAFSDLFEARPPGSSSYHIRPEVVAIRGPEPLPLGRVYYLPKKKRFYVQYDSLGSSTLHYYGPFKGDPYRLLDLPRPARRRER